MVLLNFQSATRGFSTKCMATKSVETVEMRFRLSFNKIEDEDWE